MTTIYALVNKFNAKGISLWQEDGQLKFKASKGKLTPELREELIAKKQDIVKFFQQIAKRKKYPAIKPVSRTDSDGSPCDSFPLSFAQERLWFIDQLDPDSASYNVPKAVTITGPLNVQFLEQAFSLMIARHENLRTIFPSKDGKAQQVILESLDFKLPLVDMSHHSDTEVRNQEAFQYCKNEATTPFDLGAGPLIRGKLMKLADEEHILMLTMHHIISDGWSVGIMIKEFGVIMESLRQGQQPNLPPLPVQYLDYSVWQRNLLDDGGLLEKQLDYWQNKLNGVEERLNLATDFPRPKTPNFEGSTEELKLDKGLTNALIELTEQHGSTLYMILMAAFKALLHRYTGQEDICFGGPIANRQHEETEGLIGMFANTLVYRDTVESDDPFTALLAKVKHTCLEAYEHQDTPFEKIVDLVQPDRTVGISPLFQVMFVLNNVSLELTEKGIQDYPLDINVSRFDLIIHLRESSEGLEGVLRYKTALFKPQTIARMVKHFEALCKTVVAAPETKICDIDYLTAKERQSLLVDNNANQADYPQDKCIHELFAIQAQNSPDKIAVVEALSPEKVSDDIDSKQLTFQQLQEQSETLALYLQTKGVEPDTIVGLCVERSLEMMVGIQGILKAGGAYVPLDPEYPEDRLCYMLEDTQANIIVTQAQFVEKVQGLVGQNTHIVVLDELGNLSEELRTELRDSKPSLEQTVKPENLAYVIYTSGSTGKPKGVMIEHRMVADYCYSVVDKMDLDKCETFAAVSSFSSDLGNIALYVPVLFSKTLYVFSNDYVNNPVELHSYIDKHPIDCMKITPSHFEMFKVSDLQIINVQKALIFAGEPLTKGVVELVKGLNPKCKVFNNYGPTETTISKISSAALTRNDIHNVTSICLGQPLNNAQVYILDKHNQPVPVGVPGELHIAGAGVARGYLNRQELNQEKFIANPFAAQGNMYKSGDLARWLDDGNIEYLGRVDTQVKIRGFRIETAEIETILNQHSQIKTSVVVAQNQNQDESEDSVNKQLVAFYVPEEPQQGQALQQGLALQQGQPPQALEPEELKEHLLQTLPEYMLPMAFVKLDEIPLTGNGKVDRRDLEQTNVSMTSGEVYLAPRNKLEESLVKIWAEVLHLEADKIGVNDDFFALGGHSLLAVMLVSKVKRELQMKLPLQALFDLKTVAGIAEFIMANTTLDRPNEFLDEQDTADDEFVEGVL